MSSPWTPLLLAMVLAALGSRSLQDELPAYYLGYISSLPDAAIPESLAMEWDSAFQVAVELLNSDAKTFKLETVRQNCSCDFSSAQEAATKLLAGKENLVGVVGPACSQAALSAAKALEPHNIVLVSFSATASKLSDRSSFPNFFRTVYSDEHQALALASSIDQLRMTNLTLVHTNDIYSLALAQKLQTLCGDNVFKMQLLELGVNASINERELEGMFNAIEPYTSVVLTVQPAVAQKIWKLVADLGKLSYPWWYLGSEGVTATAPQMQGRALEGEVGIAPYGGDSSSDLVCQRFYRHWSQTSYPGLSNQSSSYVPYVIDSVKAFFEVISGLQASGVQVNSSNVLRSFSSSKTSYKGCTGDVEIDPETGSRLVGDSEPAVYDFVSYLANTWQLRGRLVDSNITNLQPLPRPGTLPAAGEGFVQPVPGSTSSMQQRQQQHSSSKTNKALVAAVVLFAAVFVLVSVTLICYHRLREKSPRAFLRMQPR